MTTDRERVEADIDGGPWLALRVLADMAEEAGDAELACGYRWLAELKKFPAGDRGIWFWMDQRVTRFGGSILPADTPGSANARLPNDVAHFIRLKARPVIGREPGEFDTISQAYRAAAAAVGRWQAALASEFRAEILDELPF